MMFVFNGREIDLPFPVYNCSHLHFSQNKNESQIGKSDLVISDSYLVTPLTVVTQEI